MKIVVIGCGYVGLVTGACLASLGHRIFCVDIDEHKIKRLQDGDPCIYEPGLQQLLAQDQIRENLSFTQSLREALNTGSRIVFNCVDTWPRGQRRSALCAKSCQGAWRFNAAGPLSCQ
ncbi:MAG: hypothetical protein K6F05_02300 [Succinivibrio sp.]|nr:hypothetical protein [Succinivibrio sp.]